jgi:DNA-binding SARP family transcriptional activator
MRFRLLGPFALLNGGATVPVEGAKVRAVLVLLLLRANRVVPTDLLEDELWLGSPPPCARGTLQAYVSRARQALRAAGIPANVARLVGRPAGYEITAELDDIDAMRFERLVSNARSVAAQNPGAAVDLLGEALDIWRGPVLADMRHLEFPAREAARLEELRLAAIEDRVDGQLALGEHATLVPLLRSLTSEHPYRERVHGQLLLALYRSGRQADALEAYRNVYRILRDDVGVMPGPVLRGLGAGIARHDPALDPPARREPVERYGEMAVAAAEQAVAWATRAGDEAVRVRGFRQAVGHYGRALGALSLFGCDRPDRRGGLLVALGRVQQAAYDLEAAIGSYRDAARAALAADDISLLAGAAWGLASATEYGMGQPATVGVLERALEVVGSAGVGVRVRLLTGLARSLPPGDPRAREVAAEAVALARKCDELAALTVALATETLVTWGNDDAQDRARTAGDVVELAGRQQWVELAMEARNWRAAALEELADPVPAEADLAALAEWAKDSQRPFFRSLVTLRNASAALRNGDLPTAAAVLENIPPGAGASPNFTAGFLAQTFLLRREQGRLAEAMASVEHLAAGAMAPLPWRAALAVGLAETGATDRARLDVDRLVHALRYVGRDWLWLASVAQTADAAIILGHRPAAGPLYDLLAAHAGRCVVVAHGVGHLGAVDSYLGGLAALLGRPSEAEQRLTAAAALEARAHAVPALARTYVRHAGGLVVVPGRAAAQAARSRLVAADVLAADHGLTGIGAAITRLRASLPALDVA